jgi:hypothetical protein
VLQFVSYRAREVGGGRRRDEEKDAEAVEGSQMGEAAQRAAGTQRHNAHERGQLACTRTQTRGNERAKAAERGWVTCLRVVGGGMRYRLGVGGECCGVPDGTSARPRRRLKAAASQKPAPKKRYASTRGASTARTPC